MGNRKDLKADVGTKLAQVTIYRTKNKRKKRQSEVRPLC